ncbi:hemerythrin domain-containing protein [Allosphingosinicella vermicomposti]|uniref:hemerythrin domain-containing protein n=1 Tax=Allosphingosinicella vermicomposti TaxID=614671 RepID=UPI000D10BD9F|nr:hemerythrin domain-containing protein [Allosphingosinicella vermicomposti]
MANYTERNDKRPHKVAADDPLAIALLKEEHQVFRALFDKAENAEGSRLAEIARELCLRLNVHMTIEEEVLYPALKGIIDADEVNEGIVEHQAGKTLAAEIEQLTGDEPLFASKVHVLGEETLHHIDEEDEEMFQDAKAAHREGRIDLDALGERLRARQQELYDRIAATGDEGKTCEAKTDEVESVSDQA